MQHVPPLQICPPHHLLKPQSGPLCEPGGRRCFLLGGVGGGGGHPRLSLYAHLTPDSPLCSHTLSAQVLAAVDLGTNTC